MSKSNTESTISGCSTGSVVVVLGAVVAVVVGATVAVGAVVAVGVVVGALVVGASVVVGNTVAVVVVDAGSGCDVVASLVVDS